jgi:hypothetical protein
MPPVCPLALAPIDGSFVTDATGLRRPLGASRAGAVELGEHVAERVDRRRRDRVNDELEMRRACSGKGVEVLGDLRRAAAHGLRAVVAVVAHHPPLPAGQADEHGGGRIDAARLPPDGGGELVDTAAQQPEPGDGVAVVAVPHVPAVDDRQGDRQHPRPDRADHQRRSAGTGRRRVEHAVLQSVELAGEVDVPLTQQGADDRQRLGEAVDAPIEGETEGPVLALVPPGAEAEDQPPAGDAIDGCRMLGEHRRRVEPDRRDERSELHPLGDRGEGGERRPHLPWSPRHLARKVVEQVVAVPHRVEPDPLGGARHRDQFRPQHPALDLGELHAHSAGPGHRADGTWAIPRLPGSSQPS